MTTEQDFTAALPFGVAMPWDKFENDSELRRFALSLVGLLNKPILPEGSLLMSKNEYRATLNEYLRL
jgi:hypothetical protein